MRWVAVAMALLPVIGYCQDARRTSLTGNIRKHESFPSKTLGNRRNLIVYLPPNYDSETKRRYPVVYMHDGQNVMDGMTSYIPNAEWRADEAAERLIRAGLLEPIIIVGIDNAQAERGNEYTPTADAQYKFGGKSEQYGKFLVDEVMPFVNRTYRTKTGAKNTGLIGSSLGGLVTMDLGIRYPDKFGKLGIVSPSVWWDDRVILKRVAAMPKKNDQRIWIDMGTNEGVSGVADAQALAKALEAKGWKPGKDLALVIDGFAGHNEPAWAGRIGEILLFLFRK